jgi:MoaA/NifB/PqqE/SkfB family radical SAM enzyme
LVIFEGGEPFIWRDAERRLDDLIVEAKKRFFFVGVTTNGTLPLESKADALWVSIDGLEENHNFNRGPTFQRIMENLERSSHPRKLAQITINKRNWEEIPELIRFLTGKVIGITFQLYYPYPETADLFVPPRERAIVLDEMIRLKRQGYPVLDSYGALEALKENQWRCQDWLIADAEPTGEIHLGCYLKGRGEADCSKCGFAAHTELSLAYNFRLDAIRTGLQVFGLRPLVRLAA